MKPIFHALKLFNFKRRNTGDWEYTAQINHHLYQQICADAFPDAWYFSSEFLLPPSYLIDSCHKNLQVVISFGKQHQVYGSLNRLHWLATWKPPIDNRYHWSDGIKVYPRTRSSLLALKGAHTHPTVITSYLADGLRVKFWYSFIFGVVFLIYQNTELLTTEETVLLQHQRLSNTKMANIRRIWMEELSWKTVGGPFSIICLFINQMKQRFSVDIDRMPRLPFFWAPVAPNAKPSAVLESGYGKLLGKAWSAFEICYPLVILSISSIDSLQCPLSSCYELVSSIIVTNKHLRYQSICCGVCTFIAVLQSQQRLYLHRTQCI